MDLSTFFDWFVDVFKGLWNFHLNTFVLNVYGYAVPLLVLVVAVIIISMVINVYWKGAQG